MSEAYEIEIKSLLGSKERADSLREKILKSNLGFKLTSKNKQLNHYFNISDVVKFKRSLESRIDKSKVAVFRKILEKGSNFSIRTRETDGRVILVIKASIDEGTSANTVSRMEFESEMKMSLEELGRLLLEAGLTYQAKWSREREEYKSDSANVCIDKNAGYGYLAEFEKVVADAREKDSVKEELLALMREMEVSELPQDRLERMFAYYNSHWPEYYGTEKIFNIE